MDQKIRDLIAGPNFAHVATVRRDGSAAVTPIWIDLRDDLVLLNGVQGRGWPGNLIRDARVSLSVVALDNPYECAVLRGRVLEPTTDDAYDHFVGLFQKYRNRPIPFGADQPPPGMPGRILFRVAIESSSYQWQPGPAATDEFDTFVTQMMKPADEPGRGSQP